MNHKAKLLLVDDDLFIQRVIGKSLMQLGYAVDSAADGQEAWDKLAVNTHAIDLVLLDRDMPRMDGLTLLKKMKADARLSNLPVVMLTGADSADEVAEGLAAGAHYYLTKPATQVILQRVIEGVLDGYHKNRQLLEMLGRQRNNLALLKHAVFEYRTLQEARDIALLLADASGNPSRTVSGYAELLINAVEHGNLSISYAEKSRLLEDDAWNEEIDKRLQQAPYADRYATVELKRSSDYLDVTIKDQGTGFDWSNYLHFAPERAFDLHGRGIAMSKELSFDQLAYQGCGNIVIASVKLV